MYIYILAFLFSLEFLFQFMVGALMFFQKMEEPTIILSRLRTADDNTRITFERLVILCRVCDRNKKNVFTINMVGPLL